jgi:hypothetical protein
LGPKIAEKQQWDENGRGKSSDPLFAYIWSSERTFGPLKRRFTTATLLFQLPILDLLFMVRRGHRLSSVLLQSMKQAEAVV